MPTPLAFFRGKQVPIEEAKINVMTHALHYGTAVFEGIRGNWNQAEQRMFIFRMREHYVRFLQGCQMLLLDIPYKADDLCDITIDLLKNSGYRQDIYIRPLAYKSEELVANLRLQDLSSDFALIMVPFGAYLDTDGALNCCTSSWRRVDDTIIPPRVKISGHYVNSILAKTEATLAGFDEAIMLNVDGHISEGSGEIIVMIKGDTIITPPPQDNILEGITLETVLSVAQKDLNLPIVRRSIDRSELYIAEEVLMTGTAAHVTPVTEVDRVPVGSGKPGPISKKLQDTYFQIVTGELADYQDWLDPIYPK